MGGGVAMRARLPRPSVELLGGHDTREGLGAPGQRGVAPRTRPPWGTVESVRPIPSVDVAARIRFSPGRADGAVSMVPRALPDARPGATSELADVAPELADAPPQEDGACVRHIILTVPAPERRLTSRALMLAAWLPLASAR